MRASYTGAPRVIVTATMTIRMCLKSRVSSQTAHHQPAHRNLYPRRTARRRRLVILAQPPLPTQPTEGPFRHPAPRQHCKTMPPRPTLRRHNLQPAAQFLTNPSRQGTATPSIRPNQPQPREPTHQFLQQQSDAIPILDICRMHHGRQRQPLGICRKYDACAPSLSCPHRSPWDPFRWFSPTGGP